MDFNQRAKDILGEVLLKGTLTLDGEARSIDTKDILSIAKILYNKSSKVDKPEINMPKDMDMLETILAYKVEDNLKQLSFDFKRED